MILLYYFYQTIFTFFYAVIKFTKDFELCLPPPRPLLLLKSPIFAASIPSTPS